jgi:signal transduction histidine kinase
MLWSSSALVLLQASVVAVLFGLAMSQRLIRLRDVLVSERQEARMQREKANALMRERSLLFAATNHDLRQPLLGVSLFADLLKSARTPQEREEHALKLNMALKEVDELLVGIQQLAAVHEASHRPVFETVKLDDLLVPIVEEYRGRSEYKRVTIRHVPSRLSITTHVPYFQRIVRNVLSNAIRYTEQGDRILIGCRRGGGLRLVIADSGRGMSEEQTRHAFNAFQRFDAEMSIPDGFGLGLFSTKSLANALGLTVSLRSHEGRGTEFSIFMAPPAGCEAAETAPA